MRAVGIFETVDQGSAIVDIGLPSATRLTEPTGEQSWAGSLSAMSCVIVASEGGGVKDWHNATAPTLSIVVEGAWEIEASNGERRRLDVGSVLLVLDRHGKGHRSRVVGATCTVVGIRLADAACAELRAFCQPSLPDSILWP